MTTHFEQESHPFHHAFLAFSSLVESLAGDSFAREEHGVLEKFISSRALELQRLLLQAHLDSRGDSSASEDVKTAQGLVLTHKRRSKTTLHSLFGKVRVDRATYTKPAARALAPRDAELNLPRFSYSHGVTKLATRWCASQSYEWVRDELRLLTGARPGKRQLQQLCEHTAQDFQDFYRQRQPPPAREDLLVLSFDAKGVAMHNDSLRPQTRSKAGNHGRCKRMANCAAVYSIERHRRSVDQILGELANEESQSERPEPVNKRVWSSLELPKRELLASGIEEARRRDPNQEKEWVCLLDGDPSQLQGAQAEMEKQGCKATFILDLFHVQLYLWQAGHALYPKDAEQAGEWVQTMSRELLERGPGRVMQLMKADAMLQRVSRQRWEEIKTAQEYLWVYQHYLDYPTYLAKGYPLASGVIEGVCRYVVKDRMAKTGAVWHLAGAESILKLRSLWSSHDFEEYWAFHLSQESLRNHKQRYWSHAPPATLGSNEGSSLISLVA